MKICIVGGGNLGTAMAVDFASKNHAVNVLTSRPQDWQKKIFASVSISGKPAQDFAADLNLVTSNAAAAFDSADYVFVTLPSHVQADFAARVAPFVNDKIKFVMIPGFGGAEFLLQPLLERGAELFGFKRVPFIARLKQYGKSVWFERKPSISLAKFRGEVIASVNRDMEKLFDIPCAAAGNYLSITLTPSNPVLHTSRLYAMFGKSDSTFERNEPFYAAWNDEASEILFRLDDEVQAICRALPKVDLSGVVSLKIHYESDTVPALTKKLRSIPSLSKILSPMKKTFDGWQPDFDNRYFKCDFEFGLDILLQFAETLKLTSPTMNEVMNWYKRKTGNFARAVKLVDYGINSEQDIYKFYGRAE